MSVPFSGAETITIRGGGLEVRAHPGHGFTIGQLTDLGTGTDLLWARESPVGRCSPDLGPPGDPSITTFDDDLLIGGWFPMFPTAGLPEPGARSRWMHGEVARLPWTVTAADETSLTAQVDTPASGFRVTRSVTLDEDGLAIRTWAVNRSGRHQEVTYGEHPCLSRRAFAGGRIHLRPVAAQVLPPAQPDAAALRVGPITAWPRAATLSGGSLDVGAVPDAPDGHHDHVAADLAEGVFAVDAPPLGRRLQFTVDRRELGHLLLWRHFSPPQRPGADVLALEPSSAPGRGFADATAAGAVRRVEPGGTVSFRVTASWSRLEPWCA